MNRLCFPDTSMLPVHVLVVDDSVVMCKLMAEALASNEASSVVWGVPGAVVSSALADKTCPLKEIGREVIARVQANRMPHLAKSARALV